MLLAFWAGSSSLYAACPLDGDIKPNCCIGPTLCGTGPSMLDGCAYHLDIGFLYEQMRITGTQTGMSVTNSNLDDFPQNAEILRPSFDLDWGLTASLGWFFDHDDWSFFMYFDWLESNGYKTASDFVPVFNGGGAFVSPEGHIRLNVNYYMLDIMLARGSYMSGCTSVMPHAGLKIVWLYYKEKTNGTFHGGDVKRCEKTKNWGIGPEFGVDMEWSLARGISLFCDSGVAVLFGNTKTTDTTFRGSTEKAQARENHETMYPAVRATLGLKFEECFCENTHYVYVKIGLDTNYYWNQFEHINVMPTIVQPPGDQGYVAVSSENNSFGMIGLRVDFGWVF